MCCSLCRSYLLSQDSASQMHLQFSKMCFTSQKATHNSTIEHLAGSSSCVSYLYDMRLQDLCVNTVVWTPTETFKGFVHISLPTVTQINPNISTHIKNTKCFSFVYSCFSWRGSPPPPLPILKPSLFSAGVLFFTSLRRLLVFVSHMTKQDKLPGFRFASQNC